MESYREDVTPGRAAALLARSECGRSLMPKLRDLYARDMTTGNWVLTPQGLIIEVRDLPGGGQEEVLRDGQNRCAAVVRAQVTVPFWVTRGTSEEISLAFPYLDNGRSRTMSDRLKSDGFANTTQLAAVLRRAYHWQVSQPWTRQLTPSKRELHDVLDACPDLEDAAVYSHSWGYRAISPQLAGFAWWLLRKCEVDDGMPTAEVFLKTVQTGAPVLDEHDPVLALRKRLSDSLESGRSKSESAVVYRKPEAVLWLLFSAWNCVQNREPRDRMQLPKRHTLNDGNFPKPVGLPKAWYPGRVLGGEGKLWTVPSVPLPLPQIQDVTQAFALSNP